MNDNIKEAVEKATRVIIDIHIGNVIDFSTWKATYNPTYNATYNPTWNATRTNIWNSLESICYEQD